MHLWPAGPDWPWSWLMWGLLIWGPPLASPIAHRSLSLFISPLPLALRSSCQQTHPLLLWVSVSLCSKDLGLSKTSVSSLSFPASFCQQYFPSSSSPKTNKQEHMRISLIQTSPAISLRSSVSLSLFCCQCFYTLDVLEILSSGPPGLCSTWSFPGLEPSTQFRDRPAWSVPLCLVSCFLFWKGEGGGGGVMSVFLWAKGNGEGR
jgi:hypothetical protein